jgi:hypothetical protein
LLTVVPVEVSVTRSRRSRRRGDGYVEYAVIACLVMVCSVVGLLSAGSGAIDRVVSNKALCSSCPDVTLSEDQIERYNSLRAKNAAERTAEEDSELRRLSRKRREELRGRTSNGSLSEADRAELADLDEKLKDDVVSEVDEVEGLRNSDSNDHWTSVLGSWWNNPFLRSMMGIFGWFSFF